MKISLTLGMILLQTIYGCCQNIDLDINVKPTSFKMLISFETNNRGIIIDTYWGANKIKNELLWDNNSPTWANEKRERSKNKESTNRNLKDFITYNF